MNKQIYINIERDNIRERERVIQLAEELIPDDLQVDGLYFSSIDSTVIMSMPYDFERYEQVKASLENAGFTWEREKISPRAGWLEQYFNHPSGLKARVDMEPTLPGSTCELRQIGTEEVPIFEIVCKEAAA